MYYVYASTGLSAGVFVVVSVAWSALRGCLWVYSGFVCLCVCGVYAVMSVGVSAGVSVGESAGVLTDSG